MGFLPSVEEVSLSPAPQAPVEQSPSLTLNQEEPSQIDLDKKALQEIQEQEKQEQFLEEETQAAPEAKVQTAAEGQPATVVAAPVVPKDEITVKIEKILEDGMADYFKELPPEAKERFQKKGQEVAGELTGMVRLFKVQVKVVLELVKAWLLTIPSVNKYFLEQEAKIKTDGILAYAKDYQRQQQNKT